MKTKTTITVEKWEYTAVRPKREPVVATCTVGGGDVNTLYAEAPSAGDKGESIHKYRSNAAPIAPEHALLGQVTDEAKKIRNEKRLIRLRPLDHE